MHQCSIRMSAGQLPSVHQDKLDNKSPPQYPGVCCAWLLIIIIAKLNNGGKWSDGSKPSQHLSSNWNWEGLRCKPNLSEGLLASRKLHEERKLIAT